MSELPETPLASIRTFTEVLRRTVDGSGIPPKALAARLGLEYRQLMRALQETDSMNLPQDLLPLLMQECKSTLPLEWLAARMGYALHEKSLAAVLVAIRDALQADGKAPKFRILANDRLERT